MIDDVFTLNINKRCDYCGKMNFKKDILFKLSKQGS